jgi:tRNA nucleotidyltransferase (CCA-adding enzyme)
MDELEELYRLILRRGDCLSLKSLAVSGDDLIAAGMEKGPAIGAVLQKLLDEVLRDPELNKRDKLLMKAGGFAAEIK